ncbi:MAG: GNAT family N-acetyltransferase [Coriobacteriales bacterium]|nr:GNAT family N-acetyltransferase [Coriobacteriales bacterium]
MQIREFMGGDFDAASRILGSTWHAHQGGRSHWQGADELCAYLAKSDYGYVAVNDIGDLAGIILVRSPREEDHNETMRMHWLQQRTRLAAVANALGIDSRADAWVLAKESALLEAYADKNEDEGAGELTLIIVTAEVRGMGVGRMLLREGLSWLEAHGCKTLRLLTDSECDWQLYEHLDMKRVASDAVSKETIASMYPGASDDAFVGGNAFEGESIGIYVYEAPLAKLTAKFS